MTKPCKSSVNTFTTRSMRANSAVRTRGSPLARSTICACSKYRKVVVAVSRRTYAQMPSRNGERNTTWMPLRKSPPSGFCAASLSTPAGCADIDQRCSAKTHWTDPSRSTAETSKRCVVPSGFTSQVVRSGPASAPALPPAAMNPNSRAPCSWRKMSAMKLQKTETTNRL